MNRENIKSYLIGFLHVKKNMLPDTVEMLFLIRKIKHYSH